MQIYVIYPKITHKNVNFQVMYVFIQTDILVSKKQLV